MEKVLLKGYFRKNLGDDLFFHIILSRYKNQFESLDVGDYSPLKGIENFKGKRNFYHKIIDLTWDKIFNRYKLMESINKKRYDLMVYIGGSIFMENANYKKYYNKKSFDKNFIPYYFIGSNIGPYKNSQFIDYMIEEVFENASDISLRDQNSFDLIKSRLDNVRLNPDIIFDIKSYFDIQNKESYLKNKSESILFSIIDIKNRDISIERKEYIEILKNIIKKSASDGKKVGLISFCSYEGDEHIIKELLDSPELSDIHISSYFYNDNIEEALDFINDYDVIAGSRFHSHILGLALGKNILPMPYSDKSINVLRYINYKGEIIDLRKIKNLSIEEFDIEKMKSYVETKELARKSSKHFEKLDKVLNRR